MSNLDEYKVKHLLLLVGSNPLPNYVAARTLLEDRGTVYLIYTDDTITEEECLHECLEYNSVNQFQNIEAIPLYDYQADSYHISKTIKEILAPLLNSTERVGLNYTGGTKAMAVHAYRAVEKLKPDAIFSYLDSRTLEMCIDRQNNSPIREKVFLKISFPKLFGLHNLKWQNDQPPSADPTLPDAAKEFADFYQDEKLAKAWRYWCKNKLRHQMKFYDKYGNYVWRKEEQLKAELPIEIKSLPDNIKTILRQHLDASTDVLDLSVTQKKGFNDLTHVCQWLDGVWLEDYVLQEVKKVYSQYPINDSGMSFHIEDPNPNAPSWKTYPKFEFDVAFILGYQLFAISCTTTHSKSLCKQKLFEAYIRARQLGGDEARVALVCCYDKPAVLEQELINTIADPKIKVFGREDLPKLASKICKWIHNNN
jgi:hypothetical protein